MWHCDIYVTFVYSKNYKHEQKNTVPNTYILYYARLQLWKYWQNPRNNKTFYDVFLDTLFQLPFCFLIVDKKKIVFCRKLKGFLNLTSEYVLWQATRYYIIYMKGNMLDVMSTDYNNHRNLSFRLKQNII